MADPLSLDEAFKVLQDWTGTLKRTVESTLPAVAAALEGPPGPAPSRVSAALMEFDRVRSAIEEVRGAAAAVERAIRTPVN